MSASRLRSASWFSTADFFSPSSLSVRLLSEIAFSEARSSLFALSTRASFFAMSFLMVEICPLMERYSFCRFERSFVELVRAAAASAAGTCASTTASAALRQHSFAKRRNMDAERRRKKAEQSPEFSQDLRSGEKVGVKILQWLKKEQSIPTFYNAQVHSSMRVDEC